MARSTVRGPGSNQHQDKPAAAPRDPATATDATTSVSVADPLGNDGRQRLWDAKTPTRSVDAVAHIGTLDSIEKARQYATSYEGPGLSITDFDHLRDWERIARLGGNPHWSLGHPERPLRLLEAHDVDWESVLPDAVADGVVEPVTRWEVRWWDDELEDELVCRFDDRDEAYEEAVGRGTPEQVADHVPTDNLLAQVGIDRATANAMGVRGVLALHLSHIAGMDGVWWDDLDGPMSAPRGTLHADVVREIVGKRL